MFLMNQGLTLQCSKWILPTYERGYWLEPLSNVRKCWLPVAHFNIYSQPSSDSSLNKVPVYRQLVPLREQGSPQPLDKTLVLLGLH